MVNSKIENMHNYFKSGETLSYDFRFNMLTKLENVLFKYENEIYKALEKDLHKSYYESNITEFAPLIAEIRVIKKSLKKWMKPARIRPSLAQLVSTVREYYHPYGVVLIVTPWNYPLLLSIRVLAGAIAAGNCAVLKVSGQSIETSKLIKQILLETFDEKYILPFYFSGEDCQKMVTENHFDYIFFTGSEKIGKIYLKLAAEKMIPTTLELGGKSPVVIDRNAHIESTVKRLVFGKILNAGQTCVAPDYVMVHKDIKDKFVSAMREYMDNLFDSEDSMLKSMPSLISRKAYDRISNMITNNKVILGGKTYPNSKQVELTLIDNPSLDSEIMTEEIFGPLLPLFTFEKFEDIKEIVELNEKPLAFYVFSEDKDFVNHIVKYFNFGGGCINDTIMHISSPYSPFGGVGQSGMGSYVGKRSFETLSHKKTVLNRKFKFDFSIRFHPYTNDRKRNSFRLFR